MKTEFSYFGSASLLLLAAWVIFRIVVRGDYLRNRRLSLLSVLLESFYWGPVFAFPYLYNPASWAAFWEYDPDFSLAQQVIGGVLIILGILGGSTVMAILGLRRSFGQDVSSLQVSGPYRLSRNPQIVAFFSIFLGVAVQHPSWHAAGWVALAAVALHWMVITEEEHLSQVFGAQYSAYCERVPRYIGFRFEPFTGVGTRLR